MDELNRIIKALRGWGSGQEEPFVHYGICGNLADRRPLSHATIENLIQEAFRSWPKFSGCQSYPVPDPKALSNVFAARRIYSAHQNFNLWEDSPYGNLRRELCIHVADWLEANKSKVLPLFEEKFHG